MLDVQDGEVYIAAFDADDDLPVGIELTVITEVFMGQAFCVLMRHKANQVPEDGLFERFIFKNVLLGAGLNNMPADFPSEILLIKYLEEKHRLGLTAARDIARAALNRVYTRLCLEPDKAKLAGAALKTHANSSYGERQSPCRPVVLPEPEEGEIP